MCTSSFKGELGIHHYPADVSIIAAIEWETYQVGKYTNRPRSSGKQIYQVGNRYTKSELELYKWEKLYQVGNRMIIQVETRDI